LSIDLKFDKWNYSTLPEFDSLTFLQRKPDEPYYKIASEPRYFNSKPRIENPWNCNSRFKTIKLLTLKSGISQLKSFEKLPTTDSIIEKRKKILLIYE
jgi:hypothetical protein